MNKLCVFSDSHGCAENMISAIEKEKPTLCFFLGDGERDLAAVQKRFPTLPFYSVRGNCDLGSSLSSSIVCTVGGVRIFAVHGHMFNVKHEPGLDSLAAAAGETGADLALFGHTHRPLLENRREITFLNPGAIGRVRRPTYALLSIAEGVFSAELKDL